VSQITLRPHVARLGTAALRSRVRSLEQSDPHRTRGLIRPCPGKFDHLGASDIRTWNAQLSFPEFMRPRSAHFSRKCIRGMRQPRAQCLLLASFEMAFPLRGNLGGQEWTRYVFAYKPCPIFRSCPHGFWRCSFAYSCINTESLSSSPC
jgi:hypothetical protein